MYAMEVHMSQLNHYSNLVMVIIFRLTFWEYSSVKYLVLSHSNWYLNPQQHCGQVEVKTWYKCVQVICTSFQVEKRLFMDKKHDKEYIEKVLKRFRDIY